MGGHYDIYEWRPGLTFVSLSFKHSITVVETDGVDADVDGAAAVAAALLLRLLAPESLPLGHDQVLVGFRAPRVEALVRVVLQSGLGDLDLFGANSPERLLLLLR